jgi:hypothetical protein
MAANMETGGMRSNTWRIVLWGVLGSLLMLPAVAMQFTREVDWDAADFIAMGILLGTVGGMFELAAYLSKNIAYRAGFGLAAIGGFLLVWINLAVGVIGSEDNRANELFLIVVFVGLAGALAARLRARGMAYALVATAAAQALVAAICLVPGAIGIVMPGQDLAGVDFRPLIGLTGFFVLLWLTAATLFDVAARDGAAGRA